ncbi:MAG: hypothetical protein LBB23_00350 [Rickettsiales bacterium]|nr:hypothetical protein [Rickettsiales bacterium]
MIKSSPEQIKRITSILTKCLRLPFYDENVPGALLEYVFAQVRAAKVLNTYDFVDVIDKKNKIGWQVKSTKNTTPVTWKRAKIPNSDMLINASFKSDKGLQNLGDAIIDFCNSHAVESMKKYDLDYIGYVRLILFKNKVLYFERKLCDKKNPVVFDKSKYVWH